MAKKNRKLISKPSSELSEQAVFSFGILSHPKHVIMAPLAIPAQSYAPGC
jgi:hypothetical protein